MAIELDHQADVVWNVDGNPDPERLLGRQLPINAKAFLLDPECLPRMANSARYMSAALERNDHWPMARCTADEIGVFLATTTAAHTVADTASEDPIAERLVGRLTPQAVVLAVRDLPDHVCEDLDVDFLDQRKWDGVENSPELLPLNVVSTGWVRA